VSASKKFLPFGKTRKKSPSLGEGLRMGSNTTYHISDPAHGHLKYNQREKSIEVLAV
jgi:hypothetical protein